MQAVRVSTDLAVPQQDGALAEATTHGALAYYPRLARVVEYVAARVGHPLSLAEVARVACLEQKYFSAYFRSKVGTTFRTWRRQIRLKHAIELMKATDFSITRVALEVGYRNLRTFERAFKCHVGVTPKVYRAAVRPHHE